MGIVCVGQCGYDMIFCIPGRITENVKARITEKYELAGGPAAVTSREFPRPLSRRERCFFFYLPWYWQGLPCRLVTWLARRPSFCHSIDISLFFHD